MKLGISKKQLLDDPKIKMLYEQYMKKQSGKGKLKGMGLWDGFVDFLKSSKILSNVGGVLLPVAAGALGGLVGTSLGGPAGTATGAAAGAAAGKSGADYIKSLGFGKMKMKMMGGDSRLTISPMGTRLGQRGMKKGMKGGCGCGMKGKGMTYSINGTYSQIPGTAPGTVIGIQKGGQASAFNTVASQFGNVRF
jgi:hypothetical protein